MEILLFFYNRNNFGILFNDSGKHTILLFLVIYGVKIQRKYENPDAIYNVSYL